MHAYFWVSNLNFSFFKKQYESTLTVFPLSLSCVDRLKEETTENVEKEEGKFCFLKYL